MALHVVLGAGNVGSAIARTLAVRGDEVRVVSRSGRDIPGATSVAGDLSSPEFATAAAEGADVVYQVLNAPYHRWAEDFPPMQAAAIEAASAAGALLVTLENVYLYGDTHGLPMTEETPVNPTTRKGVVRAEMTRDLLQAHVDGRVRVVIGRASDFYGPGTGEQSMLGDRVVPAALAGKTAQVLGDPDQPHSYTYVPDIADGLVTLADHPDAAGRAWHLPTAPARSTRELVEIVYAEAGTEPKVRAAPSWLLAVMGWFNPAVREIKEMLYEFEQPFVVDSSAFEQHFGVDPTPLAEGITRTVASYRS